MIVLNLQLLIFNKPTMKTYYFLPIIFLLAASCSKAPTSTSDKTTNQPNTQSPETISPFQKRVNTVTAKAKFHVYVPSYVPDTFELRIEDDGLFEDGTVGFRLQSDSLNQTVGIGEGPLGSSGLMTGAEMTTRKWSSVKPVSINSQSGYLGIPLSTQPSQRTLSFTLNGVEINVHTLDKVSDEELIKIAASMK